MRIAAVTSLVAAATLTSAAAVPAAPFNVPAQRVAVQQNKLTVDLGSRSVAADDIEVLAREGGGLAAVPQVGARGPRNAQQRVIPADRPSFLKVARHGSATSPPPLPKSPTTLGVLVDPVSVQGSPDMRDIRSLPLVLKAEEFPLSWNSQCQAYCTTLIIGLDVSGGEGSQLLPKPLVVQLTANGAKVDPSRLEIARSGVEGYVRAVVSLRTHESKGTVAALSDFSKDWDEYVVSAAPQLAVLDLEPSLTSLVGFGIGTATITVVRRAEDGNELLAPQKAGVSLTATGGRLEKPVLLFESNGSRDSTILRSAWRGDVTVAAKADDANVKAEPVKITFTTPWSYLIALLFGTSIGSFIRVSAKKKGPGGSDFFVGAGVGVIVGVASLEGIARFYQLPATALVTEVGCFLAAALGAYGGRQVLDRLSAGKVADS